MTSKSDSKGKGEIVLHVDATGIARRREEGLVTRVSGETIEGRVEIPDFSGKEFQRGYSPRFSEGIKRLEREMFEEKQTGRFLVFPPQVLGMDSAPYKLADRQSTSVGFHPNTVDIQIPDTAMMDELRRKKNEQYESVMRFYRDLYGSGLISISGGSNVLTNILFNVPLYHNGARVGKNESVEFKHEDFFRIGNSIIFAYVEIQRQGDLHQLGRHHDEQEPGLVIAPGSGMVRR